MPPGEIPGREFLSSLSGFGCSQSGVQPPVYSNSNSCADFTVSSREVGDCISGLDFILHS